MSEPLQIEQGENIKITKDPETGAFIISAPTINQTAIKNMEFIVKGNEVEIVGGRGIKIETQAPNKLIISIDINRQIVEIEDLKKRFNNLETVVNTYVKK